MVMEQRGMAVADTEARGIMMAEKLRVAHAADKERAVADVRAEMQARTGELEVSGLSYSG